MADCGSLVNLGDRPTLRSPRIDISDDAADLRQLREYGDGARCGSLASTVVIGNYALQHRSASRPRG